MSQHSRPTPPQQRKRAYRLGMRAETVAAWYLRLRGYSILETRYRTKSGEIDIIARRGQLLAFVEVKARKTVDQAILAVTPRNRQRISAAAKTYLSLNPRLGACDIRYDIFCQAGMRVTHLQDAWRDKF